jgi:hypothetical protein
VETEYDIGFATASDVKPERNKIEKCCLPELHVKAVKKKETVECSYIFVVYITCI